MQRNVMLNFRILSELSRVALHSLISFLQTILYFLQNQTVKNYTAIKEVLDSFCELSGQKISGDKSWVFFSSNMETDNRLELWEILGFRSTPSLGKYLGFPIKHTSTPQEFGFILDRIQSKLEGWKANLLSFAGRTILTKSVTSTIPNYVMQCTALPAKILQGVDRLSRNFLWGSIKNKKKQFT